MTKSGENRGGPSVPNFRNGLLLINIQLPSARISVWNSPDICRSLSRRYFGATSLSVHCQSMRNEV